MIDYATLKLLRGLKLPGMARELEFQLENPQAYKNLPFEDRLALLIDAESESRLKNTIRRRITAAKLREPQASVESIRYYEDRELNKGLIEKLATCAYIRDGQHVVLKGATGAGKSYLACALGVAACRKLYKVRYTTLSEMLGEYAIAKTRNEHFKVKNAYAKFDLLIIDEWLMRPVSENATYDLLELIDACTRKGSLIICTQYDTDDWYYRIDCDRDENEESAIAEGILDRIINKKYSIDIKGRMSMRKRLALEGSESEVSSNG